MHVGLHNPVVLKALQLMQLLCPHATVLLLPSNDAVDGAPHGI